MPDGLDNPIPEETRYLWEIANEIGGLAPLTFSEIKTWSELSGYPLQFEECAVIRGIHRIICPEPT